MLEKLAEINWSEYRHAYGPADDVPDLLRALASPEASVREGAWWDLYGTIYHQGSVYSATVQAVPFLIELLSYPEVEDKHQILLYLSHLGRTQSYEFVDEWVKATAEAVAAGGRLYGQFLASGQEQLQVTALCVLAWCGAEYVPIVVQQAPQISRLAVRVLLLLAVGRMADKGHLLFAEAELHEEKVVQLAGTLAWAYAAGENLPPEALKKLQQLLQNPSYYCQLSALLAQTQDGLGLVVDYVSRLSHDQQAFLAPWLGDILEAVEQEQEALGLARLLLELAFPEKLEKGTPAGALTPFQRQILINIARSESVWQISGNLMGHLRRAGVRVMSQNDLKTYLGFDTRVEVFVVTPREVGEAAELCQTLGRENWLDVPWLFAYGNTDILDEEIPERADEFPPAVMGAAKQIANLLYQLAVKNSFAKLTSFRFYPQLKSYQLELICYRLGWQVHSDPQSKPRQVAQAPAEVHTPPVKGIAYNELDNFQKREMSQLIKQLHQQKWKETQRWFQFVTSTPETKVTPLLIGKYFATEANLELAWWLYDEWLAEQTGERLGEPYLKLAIGRKDLTEWLVLRLYAAGQWTQVVELLGQFQDELTIENVGQRFIPAVCQVIGRVVVDLGYGQLVEASQRD